MAAISIITSKTGIIDLHGIGQVRYMLGEGQFNGTDLTGTLSVKGLSRIRFHSVNNPVGTVASTDLPIQIATAETNGEVIVPASGLITISRPAGTTSGLKFKFLLIQQL